MNSGDNLRSLINASYSGTNDAKQIGLKLGYELVDRDLSNRKHEVFTDAQNTVITYTGTRTLGDVIITDGALALGLGGLTQRFQESKRVANKTRAKYGQPLTSYCGP